MENLLQFGSGNRQINTPKTRSMATKFPASVHQNLKRFLGVMAVSAIVALPQLGLSQANVNDPYLTVPNYQAAKQGQAKLAGKTNNFSATAQGSSSARTANTTADAFNNQAGDLSGFSSSCFIPRDGSYTAVPRNDDGFYGPVALGFNFNLYGTTYNQVYINTNGNLTFTNGLYEYNPSGLPYHVPMVAGFWGDVDTRNGGQIYFKKTASSIIVTWDAVRAYPSSGGAVNTFQIVLTDGFDPLLGIGRNVALNHQNIQWAYGSASYGAPATVGINHGNGTNYVQVGRFLYNNYSYDGPGGNHDGLYYLNGLCSNFNASNAGNIEPSSSNFPTNNAITLNVGQTVTLNPQFIGPEVDQTVTTTVNTNGMCGVTTSVTNGGVSTTNMSITGSACNIGTNTITFTATDNGSPAKTTVETITVTVISPCNTVLSASNTDVSCAGGSNGSVNLNVSGGTAPFSFAWSNGATTEDLFNVAAGTYSVTVTDANNCTATTSATVGTKSDNTNPTITAPANVSIIGCSASGVALGTPVTADNCAVASVTNNAPATFGQGTTTVIWTVTDASGNTATASQTVIVQDNQAPSLTASGSRTINLPYGYSANWNMYQFNFSDPLPAGATVTGITLSYSGRDQGWGGTGAWTRMIVSGTHIGGNQYFGYNQNFTINYNGAIANYNYGGSNYMRMDFDTYPGWVAYFNGGTMTIHYSATSTVVPAVYATCSATVTAPTATDNCAGTVTGTTTDPLTYNTQGTHTINWTFSDGNGNVSNATQNVVIRDVTNPTISAPANVSAFADNGSCAATNVSLGNASAADNCAVASVTNNAPASFPVGTTTVTWTATDGAGNTKTATQLVTVSDNQMPVLASVSNMAVNTDAGVCGATVTYATPVGTDNCAVSTVQTTGLASGSVFPLGTTTNTFVATDASGNAATTSFTVTVTDNEAPNAIAQNVSVTLVNGSASVTAAGINNGSSDACGIAAMSLDKTTFNCNELGNNTVTLTVTDNNGNVSSTRAIVNVIGVTPTPAIAVTRSGSNINTGAGVNTIFLGYGNQAVTLTASNATSAAGATTYSWSPATGLSNATAANPVFTPTAAGTYAFTVTATNEFGCTATASVSVTVIDARCGNKNDKVLVCHNGNEICISANAVPAHLAHGCSVGACGATTAKGAKMETASVLEAYPNPFSDRTNLEFSIVQDSKFNLEVLDVKGAVVRVLGQGNAKAGKLQAYEFEAGNLSEGIYIIRLTTDTEVKHLKMVLKH